LFVVRQHDAACRRRALRVENAMPGRAVRRRVHCEPDGSRRVTFAEQFCDLAVSHHASAWNAAHDFVNALAVLRVSLLHHLSDGSQHRARRRAVAKMAAQTQWQTDQLILSRRYTVKTQAFENDHLVRE
jgi:hypothetical protein